MFLRSRLAGSGSAVGWPVPLQFPQLRKGAPSRDGVGVVGAEDALADGKGALEEGAGGCRVALSVEEEGQVVESEGSVGMVTSHRAIGDGQRALEERPGGAHLPLTAKHQCQIVESSGGVRVVATQRAFVD